MSLLSVKDSLRPSKIVVTLKSGLQQKRCEYSAAGLSGSIAEQLYSDAERWMSEIQNNVRSGKVAGDYVLNLYQMASADFGMVPIRHGSLVEQNSLIEVMLVPIVANEKSHCLRECQLNVPTFCAKCSNFIAGLYKQGYRCRKCRKTYHKRCAPFFEDDCPVESDVRQPHRGDTRGSLTTMFINPLLATSEHLGASANGLLAETPAERTKAYFGNIKENTIIDKGIFPACFLGAQSYDRFLFRLTKIELSISINLSSENVAQTELSASTAGDYVIPLLTIKNLVLTHFAPGRDDVFEIHLPDTAVISVGKATDSEELQMDTAQFYTNIREQREALATPTAPAAVRVESRELHERYEFTGETIGRGAFGSVFGLRNKATGEESAVKIIEKRNCSARDVQLINDEVKHLFQFSHINVLKLEAFFEGKEAVYLVTERMQTDMCQYITKSPGSHLDEETCRILIYQMIVALRYLHDKECGHLDVKCENILLSLLKPVPPEKSSGRALSGIDPTRDYPLVKLADFGYTRKIGEHSRRKTRVGTLPYNPPEMMTGQTGYNRLADMWSAGVVMYAALSGYMPFSENTCSSVQLFEVEKKTIFSDERWQNVSRLATDLLENHLLVIKVESRAKSSGVLFHDWFSDLVLFKHLREIERRTRYLMLERKLQITPAANWLTAQRGDDLWLEYQAHCRQ